MIRTYNITLERDVAEGEHIESEMGSVTILGKVGRGATIKAQYNIKVREVDEGARLTSSMGNVNAGNLGNNVRIDSQYNVRVGNVGDNCRLTSDMGNVTLGNIGGGHDSRVKAQYNIQCHDVGQSSRISSSMGRVTCRDIGRGARVSGQYNLTARCVADTARLTSSMGRVTAFSFGEKATVKAQYNIEVETAHPTATLDSNAGKVIVGGKVVKERASSRAGGMSIRSVSSGSGARSEVTINGMRIANYSGGGVSVNYTDGRRVIKVGDTEIEMSDGSGMPSIFADNASVGRFGVRTIARPAPSVNTPVAAPVAPTPPMPKSKPNQLIAQELKQHDLDVRDVEAFYEDNEDYKQMFCTISLGLMLDPVMLGHTGHSYDRASIADNIETQLQADHPVTDPLSGNKPISDYTLTPNIALRDFILLAIKNYVKQRPSPAPAAAEGAEAKPVATPKSVASKPRP